MRRFRVKIRERTDVPAALDRLRHNCLAGGVAEDELAALFGQVAAVVNQFVDKGKQVAAVGSQLRASRVFKATNCTITVDVAFGCGPPSVLSRIYRFFARG